jgi:hypothetical protein
MQEEFAFGREKHPYKVVIPEIIHSKPTMKE